MELPIAQQSYQPTTESLVRAIHRSRIMLARMTAEETQLDGAIAMTNPDRPGVRCANFAADVTALSDELFAHFRDRNVPCHVLRPADVEPIPSAEDRGYRARTKRLLVLQSYRPPQRLNESLQILPARSILPQLRGFYVDFARQGHNADSALADAMIDHLDESRFDLFVGRLNGQIAAVAGVISLGDVGVISPAYIAPDHRRKGVAATLLAATLEHCSRAQFEKVIMERSEGCDSVPFYESIGFADVVGYPQYVLDA